jgi:hypothetical protein
MGLIKTDELRRGCAEAAEEEEKLSNAPTAPRTSHSYGRHKRRYTLRTSNLLNGSSTSDKVA